MCFFEQLISPLHVFLPILVNIYYIFALGDEVEKGIGLLSMLEEIESEFIRLLSGLINGG